MHFREDSGPARMYLFTQSRTFWSGHAVDEKLFRLKAKSPESAKLTTARIYFVDPKLDTSFICHRKKVDQSVSTG